VSSFLYLEQDARHGSPETQGPSQASKGSRRHNRAKTKALCPPWTCIVCLRSIRTRIAAVYVPSMAYCAHVSSVLLASKRCQRCQMHRYRCPSTKLSLRVEPSECIAHFSPSWPGPQGALHNENTGPCTCSIETFSMTLCRRWISGNPWPQFSLAWNTEIPLQVAIPACPDARSWHRLV
jgi:hypothetical protein